MHAQTDINSSMRSILIDWLVEVHYKFRVCASFAVRYWLPSCISPDRMQVPQAPP